MNPVESAIADHIAKEHERRNAELRKMLENIRSIEDVFSELSALKGFNVEERMRACA